MHQELTARTSIIVKELFGIEVEPVFTRPDEQFGDFATNVAMQLANQPAAAGKKPRDIAELIAAKLQETDGIAKAEVAGPGFINLTLSDMPLLQEMLAILREAEIYGTTNSFDGQKVVAEYSDPNPFKVLHAGHLYTSVVGDAIANLLAAAGADVHRVNFGGDVGRHVGMTMWAIITHLGGELPDKLHYVPTDPEGRAAWMSERYVEGNEAYETDEAAKAAIITYNKQVYQLHADGDHDSPFAKIYWTCRQWSYEYFDYFYRQIGSGFERYYPESTTAPIGIAKAKELLAKGVLEESDGAVVFRGEAHGLHTRVFLTQQGLPTYETKDLGLIVAKYDDYAFDRSVIITGNDIIEYMKVVLKVVEQFAPELAAATTHLTHGIVKLQGGVKMSSRKGNIIGALDIVRSAETAVAELHGQSGHAQAIVYGAVKYAFLKQRIGGDIMYDPKDSVSLEGNSGPYLQYAHARARSILRKPADKSEATPPRVFSPSVYAEAIDAEQSEQAEQAAADTPLEATAENYRPNSYEPDERSLMRKLSEYPEAVARATDELMPHHICTYLYELAQAFNRFYEKNRVIGDRREPLRLQLVEAYAQILHNGLTLLNIPAPDHM